MHLGTITEIGAINDLGQKKPVYFNSNEYHGKQFLTPDAANAGYSNTVAVKDRSVIAKGVGALLQLDPGCLMTSAEDALLRMLVLYSSARKILRDSINISDGTGSNQNANIAWSIPEKAWLFSSLVERATDIPSNTTDPEHVLRLRSYLAAMPDAPPDAFGKQRNETLGHIGVNSDVGSISEAAGASYVSGTEAVYLEQLTPGESIGIARGLLDDKIANSCSPGHQVSADLTETSSETNELFSNGTNARDLTNEENGFNTTGLSRSVSSDRTPCVDMLDANSAQRSLVVESPGILDQFFSSNEDLFTSTHLQTIGPAHLAEVAVQDLYARLLWTSSLRHLSRQQEELVEISRVLQEHDDSSGAGNNLAEASDPIILVNRDTPVPRHQLLNYCTNLTEQVRETSSRVQNLEASVRRISKRLMDRTALASNAEGRISKVEYEKLCTALDEHMEEIDRWSVEMPANAEEEEEHYEDALERLQRDYGELAEDGRFWKPEDIIENHLPTKVTKEMSSIEGMDHLFNEWDGDDDDVDDESLEDFDERIESEYEEWSELL